MVQNEILNEFNTKDEALDYAKEHLGKYDREIVMVAGRKTWLSAASLPLEERLRNPIERAVSEFFSEMGYEDDDALYFIGAELSGKLEEMIEKNTDLDILCAGLSF